MLAAFATSGHRLASLASIMLTAATSPVTAPGPVAPGTVSSGDDTERTSRCRAGAPNTRQVLTATARNRPALTRHPVAAPHCGRGRSNQRPRSLHRIGAQPSSLPARPRFHRHRATPSLPQPPLTPNAAQRSERFRSPTATSPYRDRKRAARAAPASPPPESEPRTQRSEVSGYAPPPRTTIAVRLRSANHPAPNHQATTATGRERPALPREPPTRVRAPNAAQRSERVRSPAANHHRRSTPVGEPPRSGPSSHYRDRTGAACVAPRAPHPSPSPERSAAK